MANSNSASTISLHSHASSVIVFNGLNFSEWCEQVKFHLGVLDLDVALLKDKPAAITDSSSEEEKLYHKAWERSNRCSEEFSTKPFAEDAPKENWTFTYKTYPCPRKYRCSWNPPPEGWIKLNFGGSGRSLAKIWQVLVAFVTMSLKHLYLFTMVMVLLAMWIKLWHLLNH
ncbi:hypothetical protein ACH5RR_022680 [Cinchona calisaya]|uniref:Retrotransposon Copia-like N-terminal domain-containing protein n=1 Tax=Cinchona calisaya TaxID=153742 RepID=A0ABD2ZDG4_9GENT